MKWERIQLFCIENLVWVLIGFTFIIFSVLNPRFSAPYTIYSILQDASMLGPLALGLGLCILAGSFDVSLCRIAGLTCVIAAWLHKFTDLPLFLIIPVPLVVGLAIGIIKNKGKSVNLWSQAAMTHVRPATGPLLSSKQR